MNTNLKEVVFILDRSGSMSGKETDVIGSFNSMLEKFKKECENAVMTTVLFDDISETLHDRLPVTQIAPITKKDYYTRGCTALLDCIGETVEHIKEVHHYIRPEDVPADVTVVINTDGYENASHQFTSAQIKKLVEAQKERGWEFLFIGADLDCFDTAESIGIERKRVIHRTKDIDDCYGMMDAVKFCMANTMDERDIVAEKASNRKGK